MVPVRAGAPKLRWLVVVVAALLGLGGVLLLRCGGPAEPGATSPGWWPRPKQPLGAEPAELEIQGRMLLEDIIEDDDPWGDPSLSPATDCVVRVWRSGVQVAEPTRCGADGRFVAALNERSVGRVSVELESPGRLRAMVTVELPEDGPGVLPDVAVGMAQRVRGQVVDLRGDVLAGVLVEARPIPDLGEPEPWRRTTGEDGTFDFDTLPPGPVALRCDAPGHAPTVAEVIAPQDDVLLRMGGLYDVRGRVLAAGTEADIPAATVRLEGSGVWPARVVEVDPEGSFVVPQVPDGVYALEAIVAADPGGPAFASLPLEGVEPDLEVSLALLPAQWVPVRAVDPAGAPVAGARVTLMNAQVGLLGRTAVTDADGQAWLGPVVPGPYVARADADGLLGSAPASVVVEDDEPERVVLRLEQPGRLVVAVVDPGGAAVWGAQVRLSTDAVYSVGEAQTRAATFTRSVRSGGTLGVVPGPVPEVPLGDEDDASALRRTGEGGVVAFEGLVPGAYTVTASHPEYAASAEQTTSVRAGERSQLTLMLREGQPLTGRVADGNGRPVEGAQVRVNDVLLARTDARGVYDAGSHAGPVKVSVRAPGFATASKIIRVGDAAVDTEWTLVEADGALEGQVLGGNDRPLSFAEVTVHPQDDRSRTALTDDKGAFSFEGLARGRAEVVVEHDDYVATTVPVTIDEAASLRVKLVEGWSTTVVVRWKRTGDPVAGARVRVGGLTQMVDARGDAVLSGLAGGRVPIEVSAVGAPHVRKTLRRAAAEGQTVFVELVEGGGLTGRVTDYRGDPVGGATVAVRTRGGDEVLAEALADGRGRYAFDGLPAGDVDVQAWAPTRPADPLGTEVLERDVKRGHVTSDVVFKLPRG